MMRSLLIFTFGTLAVITVVGVTYHRAFVTRDYIMQYEVGCNPASESCYQYMCTEEDGPDCESYTYKYMERNAGDLYKLCGADITTCDAAQSCTPGEDRCSETQCDIESEECAVPTVLDEELVPCDIESEGCLPPEVEEEPLPLEV